MVPRNNVDETDAKDLIDELTVLANMVCKKVSNAHQNIALHPFASFASKKVIKQILCLVFLFNVKIFLLGFPFD